LHGTTASDILPSMLRCAIILLPVVFSVAHAQSTLRVDTGRILLEVNQSLHSRVTSRGASTTAISGWSASETVTVGGREIQDFAFRRQNRQSVRDGLGSGRRFTIAGEGSGLRKEVAITAYPSFPATLVVQVRYTNIGGSPLTVDKWTNHAYMIPVREQGETPFWSFQSGSYQNRPSWVLPLKAGFQQENFQGMNSQDYGGGTPVSDVWRRDGGIAVGHLELVPKLVSLPVRMPDNSHAAVAVSYAAKRTLQPGETQETFRTFVTVHKGDYFAALREYRKMMIAQGVRFPPSPPSAFEPIWCAWGYHRDFKPEQIYGALPVVNKLGFGWVTLDDGWQTAEGDWYVSPKKFPAGDADMKKMVDRIHADGFKAQLWWAPMTANPESDLIRKHPEQLLLNEDGSKHKVTYWNAFYLCPASPEVRQDAARFVTKAIKEWGYDGFKLDGQNMNAAPLCYNPAHRHASPSDSFEGVPGFFKAIYDAAIAAKPDAVVEFCPCGTSYSFFTLPYMNMAVASDPRRSWQVRTKGKSLKALMGDEIAYFGDHVELSDEGTDFASSVGLGAVVGTEFTWPVGSGPAGRDGRRRGDLTPEREVHWEKWLRLYKEKMLSKGEYLGELYDIGFDAPETHAIRKGTKMYYSLYAPEWKGTVELRGLSNRKYRVVDYANDKDLGVVQGAAAKLEITFSKHLMLEVSPQ
jgi:alpha-galactosidase